MTAPALAVVAALLLIAVASAIAATVTAEPQSRAIVAPICRHAATH